MSSMVVKQDQSSSSSSDEGESKDWRPQGKFMQLKDFRRPRMPAVVVLYGTLVASGNYVLS